MAPSSPGLRDADAPLAPAKRSDPAANRAPAPGLTPQFAGKTPVWKISPAHGQYFINSVAVSADGGRVLGGTFYHHYGSQESRRAPGTAAQPSPNRPPETGTFGVYCYSAAGELRWRDEFDAWQGVYWVAISADGARAAAGGFMTERAPQGFVRIYDANRGATLLTQRTQQRVNQVALSGDGTWVVSAAETLLLFRQRTSPNQTPYVRTGAFSPDSKDGIVSTAISADGLTVVYADYDGHIGVLANEAGKLARRAEWKVPGTSKADFCHMVDLAPDGKSFAAGGADGVFYFFDVAKFIATGQPTCSYQTGVHGAVYGVAGAQDGSMFAGVVNQESRPNYNMKGVAYLVRVAGGTTGEVFETYLMRNPNSAALNAAHGLFAVADGHPDGTPGHFYLFNGAGGGGPWAPRLSWWFETGNMSWPVVIAANGSAVVGGSDDSCIYYFTP